MQEDFRRGVGFVKPAHVPYVAGGKSTHAGEGPSQIGGDHLHHGISPAQRLLLFDDGGTDIPIQRDQFAVDDPDGREPGGGDTLLQPRDERMIFRDGRGRFHGAEWAGGCRSVSNRCRRRPVRHRATSRGQADEQEYQDAAPDVLITVGRVVAAGGDLKETVEGRRHGVNWLWGAVSGGPLPCFRPET